MTQGETASGDVRPGRPFGITIIALVAAGIGIWNSMVAYSVLWAGGWASWVSLWTGQPVTAPPVYEELGASAIWLGFLLLATAIATVAAAGGLWLLTRWAWWLAVGGLIAGLLTDIFAAFAGVIRIEGTIMSLLAIAALLYLFLPHVRRAFAASALPEASPEPAPQQ
jgi:hypothetical protein